jgi:hypothetical protein
MKKIKNLFILSALTLCAFCLGTNIVEAQATANNFTIACSPREIEKGQISSCYLLAKIYADGGVGIDGVVTTVISGEANSTQSLQIVKVEPAPAKTNDMEAELVPHGASPKQSAGAGATSFTCDNSSGAYPGCYVFYAKKDKSITPVTEFAENNVQALQGYSGYTVIGYYQVQLKEDANMKTCGRLCVQAKYAATPTGYSGLDGGMKPCEEVSPSGVPTGSFASYTLLIGAAFVALGAITLAKKHNKFYRV